MTLIGDGISQTVNAGQEKTAPTGEAVPANREYDGKLHQIVSRGHLAGYLAIISGIALWGFHTQKAGLGSAPSGQIVEHSQAIKNYLISILADWALLYYYWAGVHWHGGNLKAD